MIDALPALNRTDATFKDDVDTFFGVDLPAFSVQAESARLLINSNTTTTLTQANLATAQVPLAQAQVTLATQQAAAAASSALSAGATVWVSGTTYAIGNARYSPLNSQMYRRLTAGAGTTDPSLDTTNWIIINGITSEAINLPVNNLPLLRPTLDLDFANSQAVDPRITFTRNSIATRTNAKGLIEVVPANTPRIDFDAVSGVCKGLLIEEARTNLLLYSEQFDNAVWVKNSPLIVGSANSILAPDGLMTADTLTTTNAGNFYQDASASGTGTFTASIYVHNSSTCVNVNLAGFFIGSSTEAFGGLTFNPQTGNFISSTTANYTITNVGGGWYRYSIFKTGTIAGNTSVRVQVYNQVVSANTLVIWGAQLEAGAFPTSYQPSIETFTGRTSIGTYYGSNGLLQTALSGVARLNYDPMDLSVQPKLLLEGASTNLRTYSEDFSNAVWTRVNATITSNALTAPDGTLTADLNTAPTTGNAGVYSYLSISINTVYTLSVFFKPNTATFPSSNT